MDVGSGGDAQADERHGAWLQGVPKDRTPPGLGHWIEAIRTAVAGSAGEGPESATALIIESEPRYYDDQDWHAASSKSWQRTKDQPNGTNRMSSALMSLILGQDCPKLRAAMARAASVSLGCKSFRYILDVGLGHAALYAGSAECGRLIFVQPGPAMGEARAHPDVMEALGRAGEGLAPGWTRRFGEAEMGGPLPRRLLTEASMATRHGADHETYATKLDGGAVALHVVGSDGRRNAAFGRTLALWIPPQSAGMAEAGALPLLAGA